MKALIIYYLIGVAVSSFHIWFYRYSKNRREPKRTDAFGSLFGVWLWPLQIALFVKQNLIQKQNKSK
jgi:hypothetical protein